MSGAARAVVVGAAGEAASTIAQAVVSGAKGIRSTGGKKKSRL
jgi:hypothetical protein